MKAIMREEQEMKDSGIGWIGKIPYCWLTARLKDVSEIQTGSTPDKKFQAEYYSQDGGIPWIKAENLGTPYPILETKEYLTSNGCSVGRVFPANTVYVCCIASIGKVGYSTIQCSCNQQINGILFDNKYINYKYGYYLSISQEEEYVLRASGNVLKILNTQQQSYISCVIPTLNEQQLIANYLDDRCSKIDAIIAEAKASIEEYKELKYATISGVMQKGLESKIALKDSGINWFGKIPLDAEVVKMKNVATIVDCKNRTADNITDGEYTVIRTSCIKDGKFSLAGSYNTNEANYLEWTERGKPKIGDIFFTREAPAGEACLVPNMDNICMGQRVMYFRPHNDMDSLYILYSIYSELCRVYIDKRTKGSTVGHLKLGDVDCLPIIKRPLDEQKKISAFLSERLISIDGLVSEKQFLIEDLEAYKKSLIYEVVTGKRKVVA